jgi:uncharacterized repeat protein (TIGR01451 family)
MVPRTERESAEGGLVEKEISMRKRMSRYWVLPVAAGLALVMTAVALWGTGPVARAQTATPTTAPTATATPNPACQLSIDKTADDSTVPEGGNANYTITITNDGNGDCVDPTITDAIPDDTDCEDASVDSTSDVTDIDVSHCSTSGTVKWESNDNFGKNDTVVLDLVLSLTSGANEDDKITNEACVTSSSDVNGDCDSAKITVGAPATSTPQPTATTQPIVAIPTVQVQPPAIPTARPLATIAPPITGTGPDGGSGPLALGLALVGASLLLVSGAALVKRTRS